MFKDPITDPGKKSKKGRLILQKTKNALGEPAYTTLEETPENRNVPNELFPVFENGKLLVEYSFADIRKRAEL